MSDPERLVKRSATSTTALLIRAGLDERASEVSVRRTAKAVGAFAGLASATVGSALAAEVAGGAVAGTAASSLPPASAAVTTVSLVKWLMLGAGSGLVLSIGAHQILAPDPPRSLVASTRPRVLVAPSVAPISPAPAPPHVEAPLFEAYNREETSENAPKTVERAKNVTAQAGAPRPASSGLAMEVGFIDRARDALNRGDASATLFALQEYEARFPERQLHTEVLALRMESAHRLGDAQMARQLATRLLALGVAPPLAERARELLRE